MDLLALALKAKRPALVNRKEVILQHDNARPHVARLTHQKMRELGWEVLPHPPYSPDIAPSDYRLFCPLQKYLSGKTFPNLNALKTVLSEYFASKGTYFYERGIQNLPERWSKVIENDGNYIID